MYVNEIKITITLFSILPTDLCSAFFISNMTIISCKTFSSKENVIYLIFTHLDKPSLIRFSEETVNTEIKLAFMTILLQIYFVI